MVINEHLESSGRLQLMRKNALNIGNELDDNVSDSIRRMILTDCVKKHLRANE